MAIPSSASATTGSLAATRISVVGWRSPISGTVRVSGRLADDDVTCGNGITWEIQKGSTALATGTILNDAQTVPATGNLAAIPVSVGQFLYLVVDPRANQADCDSTVFEFVVEQIAG